MSLKPLLLCLYTLLLLYYFWLPEQCLLFSLRFVKTFVRYVHDNRGAKSRVRADVLMLIFNKAPVNEVRRPAMHALHQTFGHPERGWWRVSVGVGARVSVIVSPAAPLRSASCDT